MVVAAAGNDGRAKTLVDAPLVGVDASLEDGGKDSPGPIAVINAVDTTVAVFTFSAVGLFIVVVIVVVDVVVVVME